MTGFQRYRGAEGALLRSSVWEPGQVPTAVWPGADAAPRAWVEWLRAVWGVADFRDAVTLASPGLAGEVTAVCGGESRRLRDVRRMALSLSKYVARARWRATPFGLFAGVTAIGSAATAKVRFGTAHRVVSRVDPVWLAARVGALEACAEVRRRLTVVLDNRVFDRGGRLVLPWQNRGSGDRGVRLVEVAARLTSAVRTVAAAAREPVRVEDLIGVLLREHPNATVEQADALIAGLLEQGLLISGLRAPGTHPDPLGHLLEQLNAVDAASGGGVGDRVARLTEVRARPTPTRLGSRGSHGDLAPSGADVFLDADVVVPQAVFDEAANAATLLARLSARPRGRSAWRDYRNAFVDRYGLDGQVGLLDLVDPATGIGFPRGYPGEATEPRLPLTARDRVLLALAQDAASDGGTEVVLTDEVVDRLAGAEEPVWPPHAEVCFEVHAETLAEVDAGSFTVCVKSMSRSAATMTGRFLGLLPDADRDRFTREVQRLPTVDPAAVPVQLSFPPLDAGNAHVTAVPKLLPHVVRVGEFPGGGDDIPLDDLVVGCRDHRLYLASRRLGRRVEPLVPHALRRELHTPPLARFIAELPTAEASLVTGFDWGAAEQLPFLPRLRRGRAVVSAARWTLTARDLDGRGESSAAWCAGLADWRARRRVPRHVNLAEGDRHLRLDLTGSRDRELLRHHLDGRGSASLIEAPQPHGMGWIGRAHEIVLPVVVDRPPSPAAPKHAIITTPAPPRPPAASTIIHVRLGSRLDRHDQIIGERLSTLVDDAGSTLPWWYVRYDEPQPHLRLRVALSAPHHFGHVAGRIAAWAEQVRRDRLARDVAFVTDYPETGRWGAGDTLAAAENVFAADSRTAMTHLAGDRSLPQQALAAVNFAAIAVAFTGSPRAGMTWLAAHAKPLDSYRPPARSLLDEAVRLADPAGNWAALRRRPGGDAIVNAWKDRDEALAAYRRLLDDDGPDADEVLASLLHLHHNRAVGIDRASELTCLRLAHAAARAWTHRREGNDR